MKAIITKFAGWYINTLAYVAPQQAGMTGFKLFCRPFRGTITDYHRKFLNTADQFSFEHNGVDIQAYRFGNGPRKVLFLHGWQSHTFRWKAYIEALDKNEYTIYAFDAPGHGLSGGSYLNVPFYGEIIIQLTETIGDLHAVVGHSLGSFSALYTAHQRPSLKIGKLLLMAPPGEAKEFMEFYQKTLNLSRRSMRLINEHFLHVLQKPVNWFSTTRFAESVTVPGLIIHDEEDLETPYVNAQRIQESWLNSKLVTTKGLGHNLKSPDVVKLVTSFIEDGQTFPFGKESSTAFQHS